MMGAVQPGQKLDRLGDLLFGVSHGGRGALPGNRCLDVTDEGDATWRIVRPGPRTAGSVTTASFTESHRSNRASGSSRAASTPACSSMLRRWLTALSGPASSRPGMGQRDRPAGQAPQQFLDSGRALPGQDAGGPIDPAQRLHDRGHSFAGRERRRSSTRSGPDEGRTGHRLRAGRSRLRFRSLDR